MGLTLSPSFEAWSLAQFRDWAGKTSEKCPWGADRGLYRVMPWASCVDSSYARILSQGPCLRGDWRLARGW
jgi:hypothetical protein